MRINRILRLVIAVAFALVAFIFADVIPDIPPFSHNFLRSLITIWFGLIGYGLFPDIAKIVTNYTLNLLNALASRVSTEIMSQMMKLQSSPAYTVPTPAHAPIGGVSVNHPLIIDTSALIDGRILDIAKTGFLSGTILIPSFVLIELQQVSDSSDYLKRSRGRRGFEIIEDLKKVKGIRVEVWDKEPTAKTVDEKVVKLAKNLQGRIVTTDFNLNRVASVSNVTVLNVNELANAVKTVAVPGERLTVKVVHLGKDPKQGVGYLPDGTMIVVENGAELVGSEVQAEVSRLIQVAAGRMIFTKIVS